jgi:hypothetical protein
LSRNYVVFQHFLFSSSFSQCDSFCELGIYTETCHWCGLVVVGQFHNPISSQNLFHLHKVLGKVLFLDPWTNPANIPFSGYSKFFFLQYRWVKFLDYSLFLNVATKLGFPSFAKHEIRRNYFPISRNFVLIRFAKFRNTFHDKKIE